jgi:hypothetical protein
MHIDLKYFQVYFRQRLLIIGINLPRVVATSDFEVGKRVVIRIFAKTYSLLQGSPHRSGEGWNPIDSGFCFEKIDDSHAVLIFYTLSSSIKLLKY